MKISYTHNIDRDGIELKFSEKPKDVTLRELQGRGFRWSPAKKIWFAPWTPERMRYAQELAGEIVKPQWHITIRDAARNVLVEGNFAGDEVGEAASRAYLRCNPDYWGVALSQNIHDSCFSAQFGELIQTPRTRKCGVNLSDQVIVYFEKL